MIVEHESQDSKKHIRIECIRESLGHPYIIRTLLWAFVTGASVIALHFVPTRTTMWYNPFAHMLFEVCGALIIACIVYCLWVEYCVSVERKVLLATAAFSGLGLAQLAHGFSSLLSETEFDILNKLICQYNYAWQIVAACFLVLAAQTDALADKQTARKAGLRTVIGSLALSLLLIVAVYGLSREWPRIQAQFPETGTILAYFRGLSSIINMQTLSFTAFTVAFVGFVLSYLRCEDILSKGMNRCLLMIIAGQAAVLLSPCDYSLLWWISHGYVIAGLAALLVKLGAEFGTSYADAHARIEHLEAVHYTSSRLNHTLDLRVVLLTFVADAAKMLGARFASVMLADDTGESLTTVATHGLPDLPLAPRQPQPVTGSGRPGFYSGHSARAFRERQVCVADDVYTDVEFIPWKELSKYDGYSVSVPLIYQDIALGVMNLFFESHIPLNEERIRLFQTLATAASVAIANAQLYDRSLQAQDGLGELCHFQIRSRLAS